MSLSPYYLRPLCFPNHTSQGCCEDWGNSAHTGQIPVPGRKLTSPVPWARDKGHSCEKHLSYTDQRAGTIRKWKGREKNKTQELNKGKIVSNGFGQRITFFVNTPKWNISFSWNLDFAVVTEVSWSISVLAGTSHLLLVMPHKHPPGSEYPHFTDQITSSSTLTLSYLVSGRGETPFQQLLSNCLFWQLSFHIDTSFIQES